jgi:hypothetical protein
MELVNCDAITIHTSPRPLYDTTNSARGPKDVYNEMARIKDDTIEPPLSIVCLMDFELHTCIFFKVGR